MQRAYLVLTTMYKRSIAEFQDLDGESGSRALRVAIPEGEVWGVSIPPCREYTGIRVDRAGYFGDCDELKADCGVDGVKEGANCLLLGQEDRGRGRKEGWKSRDKRVCL